MIEETKSTSALTRPQSTVGALAASAKICKDFLTTLKAVSMIVFVKVKTFPRSAFGRTYDCNKDDEEGKLLVTGKRLSKSVLIGSLSGRG